MRLQSLKLKNFKGIKNLVIDAQGEDIAIYGNNGTGKTTIADALCWLLFDKDYSGSAQFEIKTLQPDGEPIHNLQHEVEGAFDLGYGTPVALKKIYSEKWTKKRGSAHAEFAGHTTEHFVDDVPVQQKDYKAKSAEIATEEMFRLLTSPHYFASTLKWEKRRQILLDVCGDVTDEDVIASRDNLAPLAEILRNRTHEDHVKVVKAQMSKINESLKQIPIRIDEALGNGRTVEAIDLAAEERNLGDMKRAIEDLKTERARIQIGGQKAEIERQITVLDATIMKMEAEHERNVRAKLAELEKSEREIAQGIEDREQKIKSITLGMSTVPVLPNTASIDREMADLRGEWEKIYKSEYVYSGDTCPNCGHRLNEEDDAEARFENRKKRRLDEINAEGKRLKAERERIIAEHNEADEAYKEKSAESEGQINALKGEIAAEKARLAAVEAEQRNTVDAGKTIQPADKYRNAVEDRDVLRERLARIEDDQTEQQLARIDAEIRSLDTRQIEDRIAQARAAEKATARADELRIEEKRLAKEYDRLAGELHLLDIFTETKVNLLEDKVASNFEHARFKLFNKQINGGIDPCCEVIYKGIPFNSNLNDGARINVGLDIINTLSRHYGVTLPAIIDNAESVTELIPMDCQVIRLVVSKPDQVLRVELETEQKEEEEAV